jgi:hypothetical protein
MIPRRDRDFGFHPCSDADHDCGATHRFRNTIGIAVHLETLFTPASSAGSPLGRGVALVDYLSPWCSPRSVPNLDVVAGLYAFLPTLLLH